MKRLRLYVGLPAIAGTLIAGCGGNGDLEVGQNPGMKPAVLRCSELSTKDLNLPGLVLDSAESMVARTGDAKSGYPAHCYLKGRINARTGIDGKPYAIGFDLRLPDQTWNGKFFYSGDAGLGGALSSLEAVAKAESGDYANALQLGYAFASSDSGHQSSGPMPIFEGGFGVDPQARLDYGYNALGTWAPLAKKVVTKFYGSGPERSYYVGCSKGGQTGMQAAARYADEFDGILAGNPGFNLPKAGAAAMHDNQQLAKVNPDITKAFSQKTLNLISSRILARCDALDGAADGIVNDVAGCKVAFNFERDVPQCSAGTTNDEECLTAAQKVAFSAIMGGAKTTTGNSLYADFPWDPGITSSGWVGWKTSANVSLSPTAMANVFSSPPTLGVGPFLPTANTYWRAYDLDRTNEFIFGTSGIYSVSAMDFMLPPGLDTLVRLKQRSKLIVYHGAADGIFSVNDTINWYKKLQANDPAAGDYAKLFVVPGMGHCSGGPATDRFDAFTALVKWVEQDTPPTKIVAATTPGNKEIPATWSASRTRPLCAFPQKAVLRKGATDLESADSFACE